MKVYRVRYYTFAGDYLHCRAVYASSALDARSKLPYGVIIVSVTLA